MAFLRQGEKIIREKLWPFFISGDFISDFLPGGVFDISELRGGLCGALGIQLYNIIISGLRTKHT